MGQVWIWMAPWPFPFFQFLHIKTLTQRNTEKLKIYLLMGPEKELVFLAHVVPWHKAWMTQVAAP